MNKQEALDALELYHRNTEHILGPEDEKVKTIETCIKLIEEIEDELPTQANALNALDTIYRQDAINIMMALQAEDDEAYGCHIPEGFDGERAKEALEHLPSAQPERKKGKWIVRDNPGTGWYRVTCSECGEDVTSTIPMIGFFPDAKPLWNYCPDCGAKVEEEDE